MIPPIKDWKGKSIEIVKSKSEVIIIKDVFNNLLMPTNLNILPIELIQKLNKDNHERAIIDGLTPSNNLKNYKNGKRPDKADNFCYLQSINSEDALVWSYFSHLVYGTANEKYEYTKDLFQKLGIEEYLSEEDRIEYFLWRRIPHPDTRGMGGPEIDFGIITNNVFLIGEAKWNSEVGDDQGKNKTKNQLQLRQEFLNSFKDEFLKDSNYKSPPQTFLLYLTKTEVDIKNIKGIKEENFKNLTWEEIIEITSHPRYSDVKAYYNWKIETCENMEREKKKKNDIRIKF